VRVKLKLIGLTGGIGAGKSTVARLLRERGVPVIDADVLAREVVTPGQPAHADIAAAWPKVVDADGKIDRKRLAAIVFADTDARLRLENMTHPRIRQRVRELAADFERQDHDLAFLEAALLVETGFHRDLDGLVLVTADEDQRVSRVMARDSANRDQVRARLRAQTDDDKRRRAASHIIDNSGDEADTAAQVDRLLLALRTS
jgi:dephospho-CoA kinase